MIVQDEQTARSSMYRKWNTTTATDSDKIYTKIDYERNDLWRSLHSHQNFRLAYESEIWNVKDQRGTFIDSGNSQNIQIGILK